MSPSLVNKTSLHALHCFSQGTRCESKTELLVHLLSQVPPGTTSGLCSDCQVTVTLNILYMLIEGSSKLAAKKKNKTSVTRGCLANIYLIMANFVQLNSLMSKQHGTDHMWIIAGCFV